jgi:hypothetical protein
MRFYGNTSWLGIGTHPREYNGPTVWVVHDYEPPPRCVLHRPKHCYAARFRFSFAFIRVCDAKPQSRTSSVQSDGKYSTLVMALIASLQNNSSCIAAENGNDFILK